MIQHLRWQILIAVLGVAALFITLLAAADRVQITFVPQPGGAYTEGVVGAPGNLNPLFFQTQTDRDIGALVFRGLTQVAENGQILPDMAHSWEISEDGLTYTFSLRDDIFWHDGAPFTADDVAFTITTIQHPDFAAAGGRMDLVEQWRDIQVEVVDPLTVRFTLPAPFAPFLSFTTMPIVPRHLLENVNIFAMPQTSLSRAPVGTGPWKVADVQADRIVLTPHTDFYGYFDSGRLPYLESVILRFYPAAEALLPAYEAEEMLGVAEVPLSDLDKALANETLNLYSTLLAEYTMVVFNLDRPYFADTRVRQALLYGLDRQALIDEVLQGQGIVAHSPYMPTHWAYDPTIPPYEYNPTKARELLNQAGWRDTDRDGVRDKDGVALQFGLLTNQENPLQIALVEAMSRQWEEIGVRAVPMKVGFSGLAEDFLRPRSFDAVLLRFTNVPPDPDLYSLWHSSQMSEDGQNWAGWNNPRADELLEEGRRTLDQNARRAIYSEFQQVFAAEVPSILLYIPVYTYGVDQRLRDVQIAPLWQTGDRFKTLDRWYMYVQRQLVTPTPNNATNQSEP